MRLNRRHRLAAKFGVAVVILMGLFPPVISGRMFAGNYPKTYQFLLQNYKSIRFHYLVKQWVVVAAATLGSVVFLKDKDNSKEPPSEG